MTFRTQVKTLALVGITVLSLTAGVSQADAGRPFGNPWLQPPAPVKASHHPVSKVDLERYEARQDKQLERILMGMERGHLNRAEATSLLREHLAIATLERQYLADGRLGPRELDELERRLDQAGRRIREEVRDDEGVGNRYGDRDGPRFRDHRYN